MEKRKKLCLDSLEYIPCSRCLVPLVPVSWVREQAKRNLHEKQYGVSIHYFVCENCKTKLALIIMADQNGWGFLEAPAEIGKQLYSRVVTMRAQGISVERINHILFTPQYIS